MPYADPDTQRAAKREWARRNRAASEPGTSSPSVEPARVVPLVSPDLRVEAAEDVIDLLARHVRAIDRSPTADDVMKGRVVAQLAGPLLRAIEARDTAYARDTEWRARKETVAIYGEVIGRLVRTILDGLDLSDEQEARAEEVVHDAVASHTSKT